MKTRAQQRKETRQLIVEAAIRNFSDVGFHGASTRDIATDAGVTQGLLTYHFKNKEELWKAAADKIFFELRRQLEDRQQEFAGQSESTVVREVTKSYIRYTAKRPELFRFMMEEGKRPDKRMKWLVDKHLNPVYAEFTKSFGVSKPLRPHMFYALVGAASSIFALAPECKRLTGLNPLSSEAIEAHADLISKLLFPLKD